MQYSFVENHPTTIEDNGSVVVVSTLYPCGHVHRVDFSRDAWYQNDYLNRMPDFVQNHVMKYYEESPPKGRLLIFREEDK